jgi:hypothetical protein
MLVSIDLAVRVSTCTRLRVNLGPRGMPVLTSRSLVLQQRYSLQSTSRVRTFRIPRHNDSKRLHDISSHLPDRGQYSRTCFSSLSDPCGGIDSLLPQ